MTAAKPSSQSFDFKSLFKSNDAAVAIAVVLIIGTMLVSLPTPLMDVLVVLNLALSIGIMLLSMYVSSPMEFTVFPSLLLIVTLLRLESMFLLPDLS